MVVFVNHLFKIAGATGTSSVVQYHADQRFQLGKNPMSRSFNHPDVCSLFISIECVMPSNPTVGSPNALPEQW